MFGNSSPDADPRDNGGIWPRLDVRKLADEFIGVQSRDGLDSDGDEEAGTGRVSSAV